jgi:hypothetical protein
MPLVIVQRGNLSCPALLCDHCGQEITTADQGNYEWRMDPTTTPQPAYFAHKRCSRALEAAKSGGRLWGTMPLECLPVYLARNLEVDVADAEEWADLMASS